MTISRFSLLLLAASAALAGCDVDPSRQENEVEAQALNQGTRWEVDEAAFRNEINRVEEEERALALPSTEEGYAISSPSDPGARYRILSVKRLAGHLEVLSRRTGSSGTSFARREIDCHAMTYRYLGEGDSRAEAERDSPNPGPMTELTDTSASSDVAVEVCARSR